MKTAYAILALIVMIPVYGYGDNIYKLSSASFSPIKFETVMRGIGVVVPPLGAVEGFMNFDRQQGDENAV